VAYMAGGKSSDGGVDGVDVEGTEMGLGRRLRELISQGKQAGMVQGRTGTAGTSAEDVAAGDQAAAMM